MTAPGFEIRVRGTVPDHLLAELGALRVEVERPRTLIHGIRDQAALQGVLARLLALGLEVVEVHREVRAEPGSGGVR